MKILVLLLSAFALTGGELADSPLQQRVLALKNALMPGDPGYYAVQRELPGKKLFRDWLILRKEIAATPEQVGEAEEKLKGTEERLNIGVRWPYSAGPSVRIPKLTVKPVIDGTLAPGEWDDAVMFDSHYHKNAARPAANSEQKWRFAWDNRYFYAADILTLALAFAFPVYFPTALLTEFASLLGYHAYLKMRYLLPMRYGAAALLIVLAVGIYFLADSLAGKNGQNEQKEKIRA